MLQILVQPRFASEIPVMLSWQSMSIGKKWHYQSLKLHGVSKRFVICKQGVGERIAARDVPKIVILNGSHDRETSACIAQHGPMGAADVVHALQDSLNRRYTDSQLTLRAEAYVTAMLIPAGGEVHVDKQRLVSLGVR